MIKIILGEPGSGKTITAVAWMARTPTLTFTNIHTSAGNTLRLKWDMIITEVVSEDGKKHKEVVNWDFWKQALAKYPAFNLYIDEMQSIMNARTAMAKRNILLGIFFSQIRKITGDNEYCDLVVASQELNRIDVAIRDIASQIVWCTKIVKPGEMINTRCLERGRMVTKRLPKTYVMNYYFNGASCVEKYWRFREQHERTYDKRTYFLANGFFKDYDSYQIVEFGESEYV